MTIDLPPFPAAALPVAAWALASGLLWLWLRRELTPARFLSIFETDGVLSARQLLAWVVALFGLFMRAAGGLDNAGLETCLEWAAFLFGFGAVVKAAAAIKPAPTTVQAKKADVTAAGDVNLQTTPNE